MAAQLPAPIHALLIKDEDLLPDGRPRLFRNQDVLLNLQLMLPFRDFPSDLSTDDEDDDDNSISTTNEDEDNQDAGAVRGMELDEEEEDGQDVTVEGEDDRDVDQDVEGEDDQDAEEEDDQDVEDEDAEEEEGTNKIKNNVEEKINKVMKALGMVSTITQGNWQDINALNSHARVISGRISNNKDKINSTMHEIGKVEALYVKMDNRLKVLEAKSARTDNKIERVGLELDDLQGTVTGLDTTVDTMVIKLGRVAGAASKCSYIH